MSPPRRPLPALRARIAEEALAGMTKRVAELAALRDTQAAEIASLRLQLADARAEAQAANECLEALVVVRVRPEDLH